MNTKRISVKEKIGYGLGDTASVLYWQTISLYLLYFYTDVFGISAAAAGTMILVTRIWDGINDPMMGIIADRTRTKWGNFRPYLLWLAVPLAIMAVLTFSSPNLTGTAKLIYAYVTYSLMMMLYTAINIPYSSLLGVITSDPVERTGVSQFKYIGAYVGGFIISAALLPLTGYLGGGNEVTGWRLSMIFIGIVAVGLFIITFFSTTERVQPSKTQKTSIRKDLRDLVNNKPWLILLFATLCMILFVSTRMVVTTYYFKYYIKEQHISIFGLGGNYGFEGWTSIFNAIGMMFSIVGVVFINWFAKRLGKKRTYVLFFLISIVSTASYFLFTPQNLLLILGFQMIGSFTGGPLSPLIWAMYADTADYSEWKTGRRATGLVFSASTMSQKFGWAFGTAVAGWLLFLMGFVPNVEQSENVLTGIRALMSIIPAAAGIISIVLILFYKLDDDTMKNIEKELTTRRKNNGENIAVT
jgi:glycoside/pentoside/hexuronide:cation symporter, GPH family